jgi:hypothetical protein
VKADNIDELSETFLVKLSSPTQAVISDSSATVTIRDTDPRPAISISNRRKFEGDSGRRDFGFVVSLVGRSSRTVRVDWKTVEGTAHAPSDFVADSGVVTFLPLDTREKVVVKVKGDTLVEPRERFKVKLSDPVRATIDDGVGRGTIRNDD